MESKKYFIKTYGCAMNYSDSENIAVVLNSAGYTQASKIQEADLIVLNSCSIRQQAEDKVLGWGLKEDLAEYKDTVFVLTGCMAVRYDRKTGLLDQKYCESIKRKMPWISIFMDIKCMAVLPEALDVIEKASAEIVKKSSDGQSNVWDRKPTKKDGTVINKSREIKQIFVSKESLKDIADENYYLETKNATSDLYRGLFPISVGCDNFCSYCIVPFSRGELEFRSYDQILDEVRGFVSKGGKIVTLLGQNVNNWKGRKGTRQLDFADLVADICKIEGDFWVTFLSSNPMDFTDKLGDLLVSEPKLMKSLNLAVQSGSNAILKKMNRQYTVERYVEIADSIKLRVADFRLTTDIIVGFPGETNEDFADTMALLQRVDFDMVYVGKFSKRDGSIAARFEDDVTKEVKEKREIEVKKQINIVRERTNKSFVGKNVQVLVTGGKRGVSYYNHEVEFNNALPVELIGSFVPAKVVGYDLTGLKVQI